MKQYRVIHWQVPALEGRGTEIKKGTILDADFFSHVSEAESLVERGYLEVVSETEKKTAHNEAKAKIHTITKDDLERCPVLIADGIGEGEEIELPYEGFTLPEEVKKQAKKAPAKK